MVTDYLKIVVRPVAISPSTRNHNRSCSCCRLLRWLDLTMVTNELVRQKLDVCPIDGKVRKIRLRWYGLSLILHGHWPRRRPVKRLTNNIREDMRSVGLNSEDDGDRLKWRSRGKTADVFRRHRHVLQNFFLS